MPKAIYFDIKLKMACMLKWQTQMVKSSQRSDCFLYGVSDALKASIRHIGRIILENPSKITSENLHQLPPLHCLGCRLSH